MENSTNLILQVAFLCPSKNIVAANNKYTSLTFFKSHEEFSFVKRYIIEIALLFFSEFLSAKGPRKKWENFYFYGKRDYDTCYFIEWITTTLGAHTYYNGWSTGITS